MSEQDNDQLYVDPLRLIDDDLTDTGFYVRAVHLGVITAVDIVRLDKPSLVKYLKAVPGRALDVCLMLLEHTPEKR